MIRPPIFCSSRRCSPTVSGSLNTTCRCAGRETGALLRVRYSPSGEDAGLNTNQLTDKASTAKAAACAKNA